MKYVLLFITLLSLSISCSAKGFEIKGDVKKLADGTLYLTQIGQKLKNIDSTESKNGIFSFKGSEIIKPQMYSIHIKGKFLPLISFYLENGIIEVDGTFYEKVYAHGTPLNDILTEYTKTISPIRDQHVRLFYEMKLTKNLSKEKGLEFKSKLDSVMEKLKSDETKFIKKYNTSIFAVKIISENSATMSSTELEAQLNLLASSLANNSDVINMKAKAKALKKTDIGQKAPEFSLATPEGAMISLSSLKGKYVLIDVWASWCAPCRASFPHLTEVYKKYKDKDFEIIGISCDSNKDKWLDAIKKDGLTWKLVIDSKEKEKSVGQLYSVTSIPYTALIDKNGIIIAKNLRGDDLDAKLAEIMK